MNLDVSNLQEVIIPHIRLLRNDERFYIVPDFNNYFLSTYGRLYLKNNGRFKKIKLIYDAGNEYYIVELNGKKKKISVKKLIAKTFFSNLEYQYIYCYNTLFDYLRWDVCKLHLLSNKEELVEAIKSKIEHRPPEYSLDKQFHVFIGRTDYDKPVRVKLMRTYWNMRSRATNKKTKQNNKMYENTAISDEWLNNPEEFMEWFLKNDYYYPGKKEIDKDIMGFGESNEYSENFAAIVPEYINKIFVENTSRLGYCISEIFVDGKTKFRIPGNTFSFAKKRKNKCFNTYTEALAAGRKIKADYIREIVKNERSNGFMPENILNAMEKWADRCELGLIKSWEPDYEILKAKGLL